MQQQRRRIHWAALCMAVPRPAPSMRHAAIRPLPCSRKPAMQRAPPTDRQGRGAPAPQHRRQEGRVHARPQARDVSAWLGVRDDGGGGTRAGLFAMGLGAAEERRPTCERHSAAISTCTDNTLSPTRTITSPNRSKQEVMNLLESAGFSRANPYYIVQQGKVRAPVCREGLLAAAAAAAWSRSGALFCSACTTQTAALWTRPTCARTTPVQTNTPPRRNRHKQIMSMANMKDSERLELLKEIGGTKVRRALVRCGRPRVVCCLRGVVLTARAHAHALNLGAPSLPPPLPSSTQLPQPCPTSPPPPLDPSTQPRRSTKSGAASRCASCRRPRTGARRSRRWWSSSRPS